MKRSEQKIDSANTVERMLDQIEVSKEALDDALEEERKQERLKAEEHLWRGFRYFDFSSDIPIDIAIKWFKDRESYSLATAVAKVAADNFAEGQRLRGVIAAHLDKFRPVGEVRVSDTYSDVRRYDIAMTVWHRATTLALYMMRAQQMGDSPLPIFQREIQRLLDEAVNNHGVRSFNHEYLHELRFCAQVDFYASAS